MRKCIYAYMHVSLCQCMCKCMPVCMCQCMYECMHVCMHLYVGMHVCMYVCTSVYIYYVRMLIDVVDHGWRIWSTQNCNGQNMDTCHEEKVSMFHPSNSFGKYHAPN